MPIPKKKFALLHSPNKSTNFRRNLIKEYYQTYDDISK